MSTEFDTRPRPEPPADAPEVEPAPAAPSGRGRPFGAALRALVLRLHFFAGVLVAPFIALAALTGLLYAFTPQLEQVIYADELTATVGEEKLPVADQVAAAVAAYPEGELDAVRPSEEADETTRVLFTKPDDDSVRMGVYVDPYTAEVQGHLDTYGSSASLPIRTWLAQLHRHLHLGEPGRIYSELAASWLWVIAAGGAVLWLSQRKRATGGRFRRVFLPERGVGSRRGTRSWHSVIGMWALVGLLFLSATGLTWSMYAGDNIGNVREALGWQTPTLAAVGHPHAHDHDDHDDHGGHGGHGAHAETLSWSDPALASPDEVLATARGAGLDGPVEIGFPAETDVDAPVHSVQQTDRSWPVRQDQIAVDSHNAEVVEELRFEDYPLAGKLTNWGIGAHMGLLFGFANQLVLAGIAASALVLIVLGYRMWWQRRPTRGWVGRPIPRGAWNRLTWQARAVIAVLAVAVGVFLPVFGVSLLCFLVVDTLVAWWQRRAKAQAAA